MEIILMTSRKEPSCCTLVVQRYQHENLWADWVRFRPTSGREPCLLRPQLSKTRQDDHFVAPIIWREWAGKSESPVYLFKRLSWEFCQAALSVKLSLLTCYLIHKRSSLVIQWEKISRNRSKKLQIRHWAVAVILLYYICSISVHVVRRRG